MDTCIQSPILLDASVPLPWSMGPRAMIRIVRAIVAVVIVIVVVVVVIVVASQWPLYLLR